jgi:hypothetical protein
LLDTTYAFREMKNLKDKGSLMEVQVFGQLRDVETLITMISESW